MRAIAYDRFGDPDVLHIADLPEPILGPDSVLVRIDASGVNPVDWKIRQGRLATRFEHVFPIVPGWDLAGVVEDVGPAVVGFEQGQRVIGYARMDFIKHGTAAELIAAPFRALAPAPTSVSPQVAGALPLAGLTAYQVVVEALAVGPGDVLLIHGGAGGVGHLAVQLGVWKGAKVIATASRANHDFLESLGAQPIEYGDELAHSVREAAPDGVSAIADLVGGDALAVSPGLLAPGGRLASITDPSTVISSGGRYVFVRPDPAQLALLSGLVDSGVLAIELADVFPLHKLADAHRRLESGHGRGKISVSIAD